MAVACKVTSKKAAQKLKYESNKPYNIQFQGLSL